MNSRRWLSWTPRRYHPTSGGQLANSFPTEEASGCFWAVTRSPWPV